MFLPQQGSANILYQPHNHVQSMETIYSNSALAYTQRPNDQQQQQIELLRQMVRSSEEALAKERSKSTNKKSKLVTSKPHKRKRNKNSYKQ